MGHTIKKGGLPATPSPAKSEGPKCTYCGKEIKMHKRATSFGASFLISGSIVSSGSGGPLLPSLDGSVFQVAIERRNKVIRGALCSWECLTKWLNEKVLLEVTADEFSEG